MKQIKSLLLFAMIAYLLAGCEKTEIRSVHVQASHAQSAVTNARLLQRYKLYYTTFTPYFLRLFGTPSYASSLFQSIVFHPDVYSNSDGEVWSYEYDGDNRVIKVKDTGPGGADWGYWAVTYDNAHPNRITKVELNFGPGTTSDFRFFSYSDEGKLFRVITYKGGVTPTVMYKYTYDEEGDLKTLERYRAITNNGHLYPVSQSGTKSSDDDAFASDSAAAQVDMNAIVQTDLKEKGVNWSRNLSAVVSAKSTFVNPMAQQNNVFFITTQNVIASEFVIYLSNKFPASVRYNDYFNRESIDVTNADYTISSSDNVYPDKVTDIWAGRFKAGPAKYSRFFSSHEWDFTYMN
jgi:hypothetical protein